MKKSRVTQLTRGIPGWDRVDKLTAALLKLSGLCVTNAQASEIQALYRNLLEHDRKPLTYVSTKVTETPSRALCKKQEQVAYWCGSHEKVLYKLRNYS